MMEYTCREDHAGKQVPFQYIDGEYSRMTHYIKIRIYSAYTYFKLLVDCYKLIGNKYMVHIKSFNFSHRTTVKTEQINQRPHIS